MKKILVVEDDRKIALALATRLKAAGYEASMAYDALGGVSAAIKQKPDLVLLDMSMPGGDGLAVAKRIQTLVPGLTPIIFITASKQLGLREQAKELGAAGFFEKPYDAEQLLEAIRQALG